MRRKISLVINQSNQQRIKQGSLKQQQTTSKQKTGSVLHRDNSSGKGNAQVTQVLFILVIILLMQGFPDKESVQFIN